ncbi:MAG TPA: D-alanine--D-alanine ligase [Sphaerochaeta sp.]|jgi:D-alanine-D-alanine ligase|nr:D-alanine--D-alanine ligase [Sphaerochaeta sp.]HQB54039.1 D-alanine--D-alanine ligase [Sphaerochaeta sp.]
MNVALIYGGRSAEHEVSINSAKTIEKILKRNHHTLYPIAIDRNGCWFLQKQVQSTIDERIPLWLVPGSGIYAQSGMLPIDAGFPTTHGWGGEDGNLQGLCTLAKIPLAGCDTVSSAIGMHKALAQSIFDRSGIPTIPTITVTTAMTATDSLLEEFRRRLGPSLFIKPENAGSSVGITALIDPDRTRLARALQLALAYSERALVQPYYPEVIEVECAVFEDSQEGIIATRPGIIKNPRKETFLSYNQKYTLQGGAYLQLPSGLSDEIEAEIRSLAVRAFEAIKGSGYARVDFFLVDEKPILNEINTLPGLTTTSHWPKLLQHGGYSIENVVNHLLEQAISDFDRRWNLRTRYD